MHLCSEIWPYTLDLISCLYLSTSLINIYMNNVTDWRVMKWVTLQWGSTTRYIMGNGLPVTSIHLWNNLKTVESIDHKTQLMHSLTHYSIFYPLCYYSHYSEDLILYFTLVSGIEFRGRISTTDNVFRELCARPSYFKKKY